MYRETLVNPSDHLWTFIGSFLGIGLIGLLQSSLLPVEPIDKVFLIGSFGASAVLIYGATHSPFAQPRNLVGGHLVGALIGVCTAKLMPDPDWLWFSCALSVSVSIVLMQVTKTLHPPGGATALIANIGSQKIKALGFLYVLSPVLTGVLLLLGVALLVNNIPNNRHYPARTKYKFRKRVRWKRKTQQRAEELVQFTHSSSSDQLSTPSNT
jgi:CBS-domain-containing membrane protein